MQIQNEKIFFHVIINNNEYINNCKADFFDNKVLRKLFKIIKIYFNKYKSIPSKDQIWEVIKFKELEEEIPFNSIEAIWDINIDNYDEDWKREQSEYFILFKGLRKSGLDFASYLKTTPVDSSNVKEVVEKAKSIIVDQNNISFGFKEGSDFFDPSSHAQPKHYTFSTGYPNLDIITGGFRLKTLNVFVGQAKIGKSLWLGNLASKLIQLGNNVAIITLEMDESSYIARIGSNLLNIPISEYKEVSQDKEKMKKHLYDFKMNNFGNMGAGEPGKLHIKEFPTSTASTIDVENYIKKYEENHDIKFKVVIIDYINIMKNYRNPNSEQTYMKIKQLAEDLRGIAAGNNWCIITATQIKQSSFDSTDMEMNSVAESSGLVATVDLMLGIIQDPSMYVNRKYKLKTLANRNEGYKNASIEYDVTYDYMRILETGDIINKEY